MKFTDIFIKRPVMGVALSIVLVVLGLFGLSKMNIKEYPSVVSAQIRVSVSSTGNSAESIQNYITQPLESALAQVEDIDYMSSTSKQGSSSITLTLVAGANVDTAFNNVVAAVNAAKKSLPSSADDPVVTKDSGRPVNPLYLAFTSSELSQPQLVDYIERNITGVFYTVNGVASADVQAPGLSIKITLDPEKISKYNLSPSIVSQVISKNNLQISAGSLKSSYQILTNNVDGTVKNLEEVSNLVVAHQGNELVRLKDIAEISLDSVNASVVSQYNGKEGVVVTFTLTPSANPLTVVEELIEKYESNVVPALPNYIKSDIVYDGTQAVRSAISKISNTIIEAAIIVMVVMFLFLGSIRSLLVPLIAIPISLIANFALLAVLGYSLNMITLLAIILAIGLVVDDAIVVLENIHRHLRMGDTPFRATIKATREIAAPVIVMTFTLAVVFLPIALSSGATGPIYKEFAVTLAGAVIISGIVSLTLSPLLCHALYRNYDHSKVGKLELKVENTLDRITRGYSISLRGFLQRPKMTIALLGAVLFTIVTIPGNLSSELTPSEDRGMLFVLGRTPSNSTLDYGLLIQNEINEKLEKIPEIKARLSIVTDGEIMNIAALTEERDRTQAQVQNSMSGLFKGKPGIEVNAISFPEISVPGSGFANFSLAVQANEPYDKIVEHANQFLQKALDDGIIIRGNSNVKYNNSKLSIKIDREKAAALNVGIDSVASSLSSYLSGGVSARISLDNRVYQVITQLPSEEKNSTLALQNYYVTSSTGVNIPLSELITYEITSQPSGLPRINQLNAVQVSGISTKSQGEMLEWINNNFYEHFPNNYSFMLTGELRSYVTEGNSNNVIFGLSFIMIFLVLAMQFNSWRDGIVIMITVPLAISGCLVVLYLANLAGIPGATMNLYTKIGIMTLVGLISKHGILMCEVAREKQIFEGLNRKDAIISAARLRFRPILMTTLAMVAGLIPLLIGSGTGANARFAISLVIVSGLSVGTLFTLFVLPMVYSYIGKVHKPLPIFIEDEELARLNGGILEKVNDLPGVDDSFETQETSLK